MHGQQNKKKIHSTVGHVIVLLSSWLNLIHAHFLKTMQPRSKTTDNVSASPGWEASDFIETPLSPNGI